MLSADNKKLVKLILKTLSIYAILSVFFYGYVGITDPQGQYYSAILAKYSLIDLVLNCLIYPLKWILTLFGYEMVNYKNNVSIAHEKGILIYYACLGIDIMIAYVSLIVGFNGTKKITFLFFGLLAIHIMNIIRMLMILITIKTNPTIVEQSHDIFNYVAYALILLFYFFYVRNYSKSEVK